MTIRLMVGDCRETLPTLDPGTVQCVVTSPPFYGLRDYGTPPLVWGQTCCDHPHEWGEVLPPAWGLPGNKDLSTSGLTNPVRQFNQSRGGNSGQYCCHAHEWSTVVKPAANGIVNSAMQGETLNGTSGTRKPSSSGLCACGAWLGSLGLEPSPELFIEHLVEVFRHVRRVLRDDGTVWVNMGDSYAGSGKGPSSSMNLSNPHAHEAAMTLQRIGPQEHTIGQGRVPGLKPKDLMLIPFRLAMALQADGWYLRSVIPWLKRNSMPESVTDRPASAIEYVFLLSKSRTYFWDALAVKQGVNGNAHSRGNGVNPKSMAGGYAPVQGAPNMARLHRSKQNASFSGAVKDLVTSRNRRNADWFFESWQGLMLDENDDPLALVVNPAPYSGYSETVRRVPVSLDAIDDDTKRTASPTCPVHASEDRSDSNGRGDVPVVASAERRHKPGTYAHPALELPFDFAPILPPNDVGSSAQSPDSLDRPCSDSATERSNRTHKTDRAPATDRPCMPFAQSADHTPHTSESPSASDWVDRTGASNSGPGDSADLQLSQTSDRIAGTPSIRALSSACECSYYKEYTEKSSHYATFPPKLVEPMVKASTSTGDLVLDPFGGSGTVGLVADRLGRNAVLCELKPDYGDQATARVTGDAPLFVEMTNDLGQGIPSGRRNPL